MSTRFRFSVLAALALFAAGMAQAAPINVTLGKPVTATGELGVLGPSGISNGWCTGLVCPSAALGTLVDGVYRPEGTNWQDGTIWWDESHPGSADNVLEIDLGGRFSIEFVSIQADNNDSYAIRYRDAAGLWNAWLTAFPFGGPGMRERAGAFSVEATAFRIDAFGGDGFYSLSEFRVMGTPIPEPGSLALAGLAATVAGWVGARRRRLTG